MKYLNLDNPFFLVMLGAIPGALGRYILGLLFNGPFTIPIGTLIANTSGSFILGMVVTMYRLQFIKPAVITSVGIGFCGSLTTMSSFAVESVMILSSSYVLFLSYLSITLLFIYLGTYLGRVTTIFMIVRRYA
jgi:CrcB protein